LWAEAEENHVAFAHRNIHEGRFAFDAIAS
jgi:hypothetical protein